MTTQAEIQKGIEAVLELFKNKNEIKKEINALIIVREDIKVNTSKEKKKANIELADYKETMGIEINTLTTQRDSLKGELNQLPGQIASKKNSIATFDRQIDDLKITVQQLTIERNGLQEELEGVKAEGKKLASKFTE